MSIHRTVQTFRGTNYFRQGLPICVTRSMESYETTVHYHDFLEISYVSEGSGTHYSGESVIPVVKGDIVLIPVGVSHVFRPSSTSKDRPLIIYNCIVTVEAVVQLLQPFPGGDALKTLLDYTEWQRYHDRYGEFHRLFHRLHYEYSSDRPGREASLYTGLMDLLLFLYRSENHSNTETTAISTGMEEVLEMLHSGFGRPIRVREMAVLMGVGERQFHRLFKKQTGMTLTEYLQSVRIHEACLLLRTSDRKISDIASAVGYRDIPFFNGLFKKKTGVTPREYRHQSALG